MMILWPRVISIIFVAYYHFVLAFKEKQSSHGDSVAVEGDLGMGDFVSITPVSGLSIRPVSQSLVHQHVRPPSDLRQIYSPLPPYFVQNSAAPPPPFQSSLL